MPQLVPGATREQIEEAIKYLKLGGIMTYYSSYVGTSKEAIEKAVQSGSFNEKEEGAPKKLIAFFQDELAKME